MLVNKRTHPDDTSTVDVYKSGGGGGLCVFSEIDDTVVAVHYAGDSLESGDYRCSVTLAPGQGKLLRFDGFITEFAGSWSGIWPQYSTINVVGDITVDSGTTLTVRSANVVMTANGDSLVTWDTGKVDFIVYGDLRIEGSSSSRVVFDTDSAVSAGWFGIRVGDSTKQIGSLHCNSVVFKRPYMGIEFWNESADSILSCRFDTCSQCGVYNRNNDNLFLCTDTFEYSSGKGVRRWCRFGD
jgi:hypothetical protein